MQNISQENQVQYVQKCGNAKVRDRGCKIPKEKIAWYAAASLTKN